MDPLSITASVVGISGACASVIKTLKDVYDKYKQADLTIASIISETGAVQAALSQIESLLKRDGNAVVAQFKEQPVLAQAFDTAITGCRMLYSCLEKELDELAEALEHNGSLDWKRKFKAAWRQDTMAALQQQIRGQEQALMMLLAGLQMGSLMEVHRLLQDHSTQLDQINHNTSRLRSKYPESTVPESVFDHKRSADSIFGAADSVLGAEEFAFDDTIVNSKAYRRAMALAQAQFEGLQIKDEQDQPVQGDNASVSSSAASQHTLRDADSPDLPSVQSGSSLVTETAAKKYPDLELSPSIDWASAFKLTRNDFDGHDKKELEFQNVLWETSTSEARFLEQLQILKQLYFDQIVVRWPEVVPQAESFAQKVFAGFEAIHRHHRDLLYTPILESWQNQGPWASFDPGPYLALAEGAREEYLAFAKSYVTRRGMVEQAVKENQRFRIFIDELRQHPRCQRLSWDTFFKAPITRLERYRLLLSVLSKTASDENTKHAIAEAEERLTDLLRDCDEKIVEGEREGKLALLAYRLGDTVSKALDITGVDREIVMQGTYACQLRSPKPSSSVVWTECDIYLLNNNVLVVLRHAAKTGVPFPDLFTFRTASNGVDGLQVDAWPPYKSKSTTLFESAIPQGSMVYGLQVAGDSVLEDRRIANAAPISVDHDRLRIPIAIGIGLASRQQQDEWRELLVGTATTQASDVQQQQPKVMYDGLREARSGSTGSDSSGVRDRFYGRVSNLFGRT